GGASVRPVRRNRPSSPRTRPFLPSQGAVAGGQGRGGAGPLSASSQAIPAKCVVGGGELFRRTSTLYSWSVGQRSKRLCRLPSPLSARQTPRRCAARGRGLGARAGQRRRGAGPAGQVTALGVESPPPCPARRAARCRSESIGRP